MQPGDDMAPDVQPIPPGGDSPLPSGRTAAQQEAYQNWLAARMASQGEEMGDVGQGGPSVYPAPVTNMGEANGGPQAGDDLQAMLYDLWQKGQVPVVGGQGPAGAGGQAGFWGGLGGAIGTGALALLMARLKIPSETPPGEGFIAPWTQQQQMPSGLWGQQDVQYPLGGNGGQQPQVPAVIPGALGGMSYAQLKGGVPVKAWTNASKDGRIAPSVAFVKFSNGMMASQSLVDGTISTWRPKKHIVISNNPRLSNIRKLSRVKKRVDKMVKKYTK